MTGVMGRWEPNSRGRLAQAALALYAEQGFEQTTVAEIARAAGLTERSFFRHFADKREPLFAGMDSVRDLVVGVIADVPSSAGPVEAVEAALQAVAAMDQETPEFARTRNSVVCANAELRERAPPAGLPPAFTARARAALGPDKLLVGLSVVTDTADRDAARATARSMATGALGPPWFAATIAHGDPDSIAAAAAAHRAAGADHVILMASGAIGTDLATGVGRLEHLAPAILQIT